jgi:hypothetical protein
MARRISWEELRGKIPNYRQPTLPKNCSGYTIWQFSGDLWILPGSNDHPIETDLFNGSWADMLKLCNLPLDTAEPLPGDAIVDPLPAAVEMKVLWYVQYLNVRTGPGTQFQVSKYLRGNDRIVVDGRTINDLWVKYADANLYVRSSYLKRV